MSKLRLTNPPWSDRILAKHWAALEKRVGPALMPMAMTEVRGLKDLQQDVDYLEAERLKRPLSEWEVVRLSERTAKLAKLRKQKPKGYREYGSGHYGCVMPTGTPGTVIKVTTDVTEASFVAAYLSMPKNDRPVGIIPYRKLLAIRSESHLKRPVFVLWRDEAQHVGGHAIDEWIRTGARDFEREYLRRSYRNVERGIGNCLDAARMIRKLVLNKPNAKELLSKGVALMDDAWDRGSPPRAAPGSTPLRIGWYLSVFDQNAGGLQSEQLGNYVGQALQECLRQGLLLADVHLGNIGMPTGELLEEIGMTAIITDPGHAIALDGRYAGVTVEEL
jgi:hypothetical protein